MKLLSRVLVAFVCICLLHAKHYRRRNHHRHGKYEHNRTSEMEKEIISSTRYMQKILNVIGDTNKRSSINRSWSQNIPEDPYAPTRKTKPFSLIVTTAKNQGKNTAKIPDDFIKEKAVNVLASDDERPKFHWGKHHPRASVINLSAWGPTKKGLRHRNPGIRVLRLHEIDFDKLLKNILKKNEKQVKKKYPVLQTSKADSNISSVVSGNITALDSFAEKIDHEAMRRRNTTFTDLYEEKETVNPNVSVVQKLNSKQNQHNLKEIAINGKEDFYLTKAQIDPSSNRTFINSGFILPVVKESDLSNNLKNATDDYDTTYFIQPVHVPKPAKIIKNRTSEGFNRSLVDNQSSRKQNKTKDFVKSLSEMDDPFSRRLRKTSLKLFPDERMEDKQKIIKKNKSENVSTKGKHVTHFQSFESETDVPTARLLHNKKEDEKKFKDDVLADAENDEIGPTDKQRFQPKPRNSLLLHHEKGEQESLGSEENGHNVHFKNDTKEHMISNIADSLEILDNTLMKRYGGKKGEPFDVDTFARKSLQFSHLDSKEEIARRFTNYTREENDNMFSGVEKAVGRIKERENNVEKSTVSLKTDYSAKENPAARRTLENIKIRLRQLENNTISNGSRNIAHGNESSVKDNPGEIAKNLTNFSEHVLNWTNTKTILNHSKVSQSEQNYSIKKTRRGNLNIERIQAVTNAFQPDDESAENQDISGSAEGSGIHDQGRLSHHSMATSASIMQQKPYQHYESFNKTDVTLDYNRDQIPDPRNYKKSIVYSMPAMNEMKKYPSYPGDDDPVNDLYYRVQGLDSKERNLVGGFLKSEKFEEESLNNIAQHPTSRGLIFSVADINQNKTSEDEDRLNLLRKIKENQREHLMLFLLQKAIRRRKMERFKKLKDRLLTLRRLEISRRKYANSPTSSYNNPTIGNTAEERDLEYERFYNNILKTSGLLYENMLEKNGYVLTPAKGPLLWMNDHQSNTHKHPHFPPTQFQDALSDRTTIGGRSNLKAIFGLLSNGSEKKEDSDGFHKASKPKNTFKLKLRRTATGEKRQMKEILFQGKVHIAPGSEKNVRIVHGFPPPEIQAAFPTVQLMGNIKTNKPPVTPFIPTKQPVLSEYDLTPLSGVTTKKTPTVGHFRELIKTTGFPTNTQPPHVIDSPELNPLNQDDYFSNGMVNVSDRGAKALDGEIILEIDGSNTTETKKLSTSNVGFKAKATNLTPIVTEKSRENLNRTVYEKTYLNNTKNTMFTGVDIVEVDGPTNGTMKEIHNATHGFIEPSIGSLEPQPYAAIEENDNQIDSRRFANENNILSKLGDFVTFNETKENLTEKTISSVILHTPRNLRYAGVAVTSPTSFFYKPTSHTNQRTAGKRGIQSFSSYTLNEMAEDRKLQMMNARKKSISENGLEPYDTYTIMSPTKAILLQPIQATKNQEMNEGVFSRIEDSISIPVDQFFEKNPSHQSLHELPPSFFNDAAGNEVVTETSPTSPIEGATVVTEVQKPLEDQNKQLISYYHLKLKTPDAYVPNGANKNYSKHKKEISNLFYPTSAITKSLQLISPTPPSKRSDKNDSKHFDSSAIVFPRPQSYFKFRSPTKSWSERHNDVTYPGIHVNPPAEVLKLAHPITHPTPPKPYYPSSKPAENRVFAYPHTVDELIQTIDDGPSNVSTQPVIIGETIIEPFLPQNASNASMQEKEETLKLKAVVEYKPTTTTVSPNIDTELNMDDMYWTDSTEEIENACRQQKGTNLVVNILAFGDSLTRGYYNRGKNHHPYTMKLQYLLNKMDEKRCFIVDNEGRDGEIAFGEMPKRMEEIFTSSKKKFDWVIILGGTNDIYNKKHAGHHSAKELTQNILSIHNIARHHNAKTVVVTIPEVFCESSEMCSDMKQMREILNKNLRNYALDHQNDVILCDLADMLSKYKTFGNHKLMAQFFEGGLHLKPRGYETMARLIFESLKPILDR